MPSTIGAFASRLNGAIWQSLLAPPVEYPRHRPLYHHDGHRGLKASFPLASITAPGLG